MHKMLSVVCQMYAVEIARQVCGCSLLLKRQAVDPHTGWLRLHPAQLVQLVLCSDTCLCTSSWVKYRLRHAQAGL